MLFVTVGTHHQPFDRLLRAVAEVEWGMKVVVQGGASTVRHPAWEWHAAMSPEHWHATVAGARVVITHAGPASIVGCLRAGRVPIVVPRRRLWLEHVDEHQVAYAHRIRGSVHLVEDVSRLAEAVDAHEAHVAELPEPWNPANPERFASALGVLVDDLVKRV